MTLKKNRGLQFAMTLCSQSVHGCCELEELPSVQTLVSLEDLGRAGVSS